MCKAYTAVVYEQTIYRYRFQPSAVSGGAHGYILGNVTPRWPWYLPPRSL
jgi:hypothetical protein